MTGDRRAFTLIELLIAMLVITVLVTALIPAVTKSIRMAMLNEAANQIVRISEEARARAMLQNLRDLPKKHGVVVSPATATEAGYVCAVTYNPDSLGKTSAMSALGWLDCTNGGGFFEEDARQKLPASLVYYGLNARMRWFFEPRTGYPQVYGGASGDDAPVAGKLVRPTSPITVTVATADYNGSNGRARTASVLHTIGIAHADQ